MAKIKITVSSMREDELLVGMQNDTTNLEIVLFLES